MAHVVITGANRGIGLELTKQFAERGDQVTAICRNSSAGLEQLAQQNASVQLLQGIHVGEDASLKKLASSISSPIDILVNNAGVLEMDNLGSVAEGADGLRRQFEINAIAPLRVSASLRSRLSAGSKVAIITSRMGSIADNGSGGMYGYRMSKAAVNAAGTSLALDLKADGIAVILLHPGYVQTDMTGGNGDTSPVDSARNLITRIDELSLSQSGAFVHAGTGEQLPW